jgi:transcriptional regulator of NAD metabolism
METQLFLTDDRCVKRGKKMKANERKQAIANLLLIEKRAITGADLSAKFGVSRQIIVQDIAALKKMGYDILPTHYGYVMNGSPLKERVIKVCHTADDTEKELLIMVNAGATVVDVFVLHNVYGKISAPLNIYTDKHVKDFIDGVRGGKCIELMNLTGGAHYHTLRAENEEILDADVAALSAAGFLSE